jgi:hypothetical protein
MSDVLSDLRWSSRLVVYHDDVQGGYLETELLDQIEHSRLEAGSITRVCAASSKMRRRSGA